MKTMIILHTSDFHFNKGWYDWLLSDAPRHDLLVMSGDLLDMSAATPARKQQEWVADWIRAYAAPVCICSGNHDLEWHPETELWQSAHWLRALAGPQVWVDGQQPVFDRLSILNIGCTTRPKGTEAHAWVVHAPPVGTLVAKRENGRDGGDPELTARVARYRPSFVFAGHVHDPVQWCEYRDETLYLNPGRTPHAPIPSHILVDTARRSCLRVTSDNTESRTTIQIPDHAASAVTAAVA